MLKPTKSRRIVIVLPSLLLEKLDAWARRQGLSRSEIIRRALHSYLEAGRHDTPREWFPEGRLIQEARRDLSVQAEVAAVEPPEILDETRLFDEE